MSLYDSKGKTLGRRILTTSLYDNRIIDQIKDYLNNHEDIIQNIEVVEMVGINETAFMINTDIFEYGAYPMESFQAENINFPFESGPFRWRQDQSTSSTTEWTNQSYLWGVRNYQKDIDYSESDFQKALSDNPDFPKVKEFNWKCNYDEENQRCTNFDIITEKSYDLLILGYEKITFPEALLNEFRKFKNESMLYDPQIMQKFQVETKNFEEAITWFNRTIIDLRSTNKTCENTENISQVHYICEYKCDHLIDPEVVTNSKFVTSGSIRNLPQGMYKKKKKKLYI